MSLDDVRSLLDAPSPAALVTYRADGSADVSPVWYRCTESAFEVVVATEGSMASAETSAEGIEDASGTIP